MLILLQNFIDTAYATFWLYRFLSNTFNIAMLGKYDMKRSLLNVKFKYRTLFKMTDK